MIINIVILVLVVVIVFTCLFIVYCYYSDLVLQEEKEGRLHTIAFVGLDVVYETWHDLEGMGEGDIALLKLNIKQAGERAQKEYKERNQNEYNT